MAILNDAIFEGSETFNVLLSGAVNATIADGTGIGTILDDGTGARRHGQRPAESSR